MSAPARRRLAQRFAIGLLVVFAAQAAYLSAHAPLTWPEPAYLAADAGSPLAGLQVSGLGIPASAILRRQSPLVAALAHAFFWPGLTPLLARLPFLAIGVILGGALFYVAQRWYGNRGGLLALALFALSPQLIAGTARLGPALPAATGAYGAVLTALAVAHTLYAPRPVVLWNWRRILLMAASLAFGIAAEFAVVITVPLALAFMLYLVPERRRAALVITSAASLVAVLLLLLIYRFGLRELAASAQDLARLSPSAPFHLADWKMVGIFCFDNGAGFALLLAFALVGYAALPKARYFGNTAPLITALVMIFTALLAPHAAGFSFLVVALPFLLLFIAGVAVEWMETRFASVFAGLLAAALLAQAYFSLAGLWRLGT